MLEVIILPEEYYDERRSMFRRSDGGVLLLEHSLASLSEWESKWKKPFMSNSAKTRDELIDYIRCMTVNRDNVSYNLYDFLKTEHIEKISKYMEDSMTATTVKNNGPPSRKIVTAEVIYSWMVALNIPFECQNWHLNKLLMLIRVCNESQKPPKKMGKAETMRQNTALNRARKAKRH